MSDRYEWYLGTPPASLHGPDDALWEAAADGNDERHWALVVGDPGATALVIYGDPADLHAAAAEIADAVAALPAGHGIDGDVVPASLALPGGDAAALAQTGRRRSSVDVLDPLQQRILDAVPIGRAASAQQIAAAAGVDDRDVRRNLPLLVELGLIGAEPGGYRRPRAASTPTPRA